MVERPPPESSDDLALPPDPFKEHPPPLVPPLAAGLLGSAGLAAAWALFAGTAGSALPFQCLLLVVWLSALAFHLVRIVRFQARAGEAAQLRLATQTIERARAEKALRRGEERYRHLFERNPGGVFRTTVDGRFLDCNEAFAAIFGYASRAAMLSEPVHVLYADPADRPALIARLQEQEALHNVEIRFRRADGTAFWGLVSEGLLEAPDGSLTILEGTLLDVSERKRAEEALRESEASILSLYNIASAQNLTFNDKAQALLELGCQRFGLEIGILARVQGERYEVVAVRSPDNAIVRGAVLELSDTYCRETLAARSTVSFEHAGASPRKAHPAYSAWGMESYLGAPVRAAGHIFGTLNFAAPDPRPEPFKPADLEFLKLMTLWLGGELEREQRNREIVLLAELGGLLQTCDSTSEAYEVISRQGRKLFPDLAGAVYRIGSSRTELELVSSWGESGPIADVDLFRSEDCWGLRLGRYHFVEDPGVDLICRHVGEQVPPRYLCLPMMALGEALGVLHLRAGTAVDTGNLGETAQRVAASLNEARRRLAAAVAEHTAMALANLSLRETLRHQSIRDPLTSLFNRRYFEESLEREIRRAQRRGTPLGVVMLDLDRFKGFNDSFGHEAGDVLLRSFGELLRCKLRGEDVPCRYGGEEFALLLPEATLEATRVRAEELRMATKGLQVAYQGTLLGPITLSLGVAVYPDQGLTGHAVLRAADAALYQSKANGRDRVTAALQIAS
jgi:diguanylate cyclase (GGDEF)-like protein/PAS domain S-box-containing protein